MKVIETKGDIFESLKPGDSFAHGANCQGIMGGFAALVHNKYPVNTAVYEFLCSVGRFVPGDCLVVPDGEHVVYNLATQYYPGNDAQYPFIQQSAERMIAEMAARQITEMKTVRIGAGIGGLDWEKVKEIFETTGDDSVSLEVFYF